MFGRIFSRTRFLFPLLLALFAVFLTGWILVTAPLNHSAWLEAVSLQSQQQTPTSDPNTLHLLNGKLASLGWIVGRDCQRGLHAYLQTADTNPDAALVGTGWLDPTNGTFINGSSNNCIPGSLSIDNVVQLVHSKGGMAYFTVTMNTDGSPGAWTSQQQSDYIRRATTDQSYIDNIVHEVQRAHYDGVIMDLEAGLATYPNIQQLFATFNQRVWAGLKPLHKWYGIALIHKLSDHDDYYNLNAFENWSLLAHAADFIVVMAVDQSYFTPGPTVSIPWLKQLLAYALQTMPDMLPRIVWELPLYGATWHLEGGNWVFDGGVNYADGVNVVQQIALSQIDRGTTDRIYISWSTIRYTASAGSTR